MNQLISAHRAQRFAASNSSAYAETVDRIANWVLVTLRQRGFIAVFGFCAIGLILTLAAMAWWPDFAAAIAQAGAVP
jgi:hypothetical protein